MKKKLAPMTKEELEKLETIPEVYKKALEYAIWEMSTPEDPPDKVWPDYFRASQVESLLECVLHDDDILEEDEFLTQCIWFREGWEAREKKSLS